MGAYERVAVAIERSSPKRWRYKWRRKVLIRDWLTGNVVPIRKIDREHRETYARMLHAAADAARSIGRKIEVSSSYRSNAEQQELYDRYLAGLGPIAAKPGTSMHNKGRALDLPDHVGEPGLRDDKHARAALEARGFKFDVASEGWHVSFYG